MNSYQMKITVPNSQISLAFIAPYLANQQSKIKNA